jgi:hypothetical protein
LRTFIVLSWRYPCARLICWSKCMLLNTVHSLSQLLSYCRRTASQTGFATVPAVRLRCAANFTSQLSVLRCIRRFRDLKR